MYVYWDRGNFTFLFEDYDSKYFSSECHHQRLNLEEGPCWSTGRKAAVKEKECTDKGGLELGCLQEDWREKRCGRWQSVQYQQDHHQAKTTNKISVITAGAGMLEFCKLLAQSLTNVCVCFHVKSLMFHLFAMQIKAQRKQSILELINVKIWP